MTADHRRRAYLRGRHQHVRLDLDDGQILQASYPGISLLRSAGGDMTEELWLPQGENATYADDERLIVAIHETLLWTAQKG